jgi:hypothetical protein
MSRTQERLGRRRPGGVTAAIAFAITLMASTLVVLLPAAPAAADDFNLCTVDVGCRPDNFNHWYCLDNVANAGLRTDFRTAMGNLQADTNYDVFEEGAGCNDVTDVVVIEDTSLGSRGAYDCSFDNSAGNCEQAFIWLNPNRLPTTQDRVKTSCHEIGHSLGLRHGTNADNASYVDCMHSGEVPAGDLWDTYDNHHRQHINNRR